MNYDANSKTFLEKIMGQDYSGIGNSWKNYLLGLKKELNLVDSILATGGSGQGETLTIPKEIGKSKTILIDLDETLVHSEPWMSSKTYDVVINMADEQGPQEKMGVFIRPFALKFL
jgi:hypothetical protein